MAIVKAPYKYFEDGTQPTDIIQLTLWHCFYHTMFEFCFEFFVPLENFWSVKCCKFWPMRSTYGHWAVWVLKRGTSTVTRGIRIYNCHLIKNPYSSISISFPRFTQLLHCVSRGKYFRLSHLLSMLGLNCHCI